MTSREREREACSQLDAHTELHDVIITTAAADI